MVWLGRDDNGKTPLTGATGALQVWASFMRKAHPQSLEMPMPENVVMAWVDAQTGQGSAADCPNAVQMPLFVAASPPRAQAAGEPEPRRRGDGLGTWLAE